MINQQVEDGILIATFEKGKFNAIDLETLLQVKDAVNRVNTDDEIKGLIFTGAGRTFCSGFDLPMFLGFKDLAEAVAFFEQAEEVFIDLFMCKKPVVSAINGAAMAGGLILSMATDYRIVKNHPKIQIGMTEIKIGLGLSIVQTELMRYGLDSDRTFRDVMFFGERVGIEKAKELRMVDEIVEEDALIPRAKEVITTWWDNPGKAFLLLKYSQRKPYETIMRQRLKDENWQEGFNCMFDPQTRGTLEMVAKMMGE